ncbi:MAG: nicotinamide-nucleotide adenylyltransferase [Nitrososphaerales archaeon]
MKSVGLFIGRFQPFHYGHLSTVKFAMKRVKQLYILVGSSQKSHEPSNPFTAGERILMIRNALIDEQINPSHFLIIPVPDAIGHSVWTAFIDQVVPHYDVVFSNDTLTLQLFKERNIETVQPPLYERKNYSATEVRRRITFHEDWRLLVPRAVQVVISPIIEKGRFNGLE